MFGLSSEYLFAYAIAFLVLGFFAWHLYRHFRSYIGFGWVLAMKKDTHEVVVLARLTKGPAGRAGVYNRDTLIEYNGIPLVFESGEEHKEFWNKELAKLKVGSKATCKVRRKGLPVEIELEAGRIFGDIPVYGSLPRLSDENQMYVTRGLAVCEKTGQWVETRYPSGYAVDELLGPR